MRYLASLMVLLVLDTAAYAQQTDEPLTRLRKASSIRCNLQKGTTASWDDGRLEIENTDFGEGGQVTFDSIDTNGGRARISGNVDARDVAVVVTATGLTFMEQTPSGNLIFTTVFAAYEAPTSQRFLAVTSRHFDFLGPMPQQYHGTCAVLD